MRQLCPLKLVNRMPYVERAVIFLSVYDLSQGNRCLLFNAVILVTVLKLRLFTQIRNIVWKASISCNLKLWLVTDFMTSLWLSFSHAKCKIRTSINALHSNASNLKVLHYLKRKCLCEATTAFKGFCYLSQMQSSSFYLQSTLCILIRSQSIFAKWVLLSLYLQTDKSRPCDGKTSTLNKVSQVSLQVTLYVSTYIPSAHTAVPKWFQMQQPGALSKVSCLVRVARTPLQNPHCSSAWAGSQLVPFFCSAWY